LPNFKAEQLYIKLDKKLILKAEQIDVTLGNDPHKETPILETPKLSPIVNLARKNFQSFKINELNIDEHKVTFSYTDRPLNEKDNSIHISSSQINAHILYHVYDEHIIFEIEDFIHYPSKTSISGKAVYDFETQKAYTKLGVSLPDCADAQLYIKDNGKKLAFAASSKVFTDLAPIVKLFDLDKNIYKWIVPYNKASSYQLLLAKGIHDYDDPNILIDSLFFHAHETDLAYTFEESLAPVKGKKADVYFTKGVLDIRPYDASYKEHKVDKGSVSIDFNKKDVILTVDLQAQVPLDTALVEIVEAYDIPLPLLQEKGVSKSHLKIIVNLNTEDAYAIGQFYVKESDLLLDGVPYKVKNASLRLHKNVLTLDTAHISYKNILDSQVNGELDLASLKGDFYFDINSINLPLAETENLELKTPNPQIRLRFTKNKQSYILPETRWKFNDFEILAKENEIFMKEKFSSTALIKNLQVQVDDMLDLNTSGSYDIENEYALMDLNVSHFNYLQKDLNISLKQLPLPLTLNYNKGKTSIDLLHPNKLTLNDYEIDIQPTQLTLQEGYLDVKDANISINNVLSSEVSSHYKLGSNNVKVQAKNTSLINQELLYIKPSFELLYHYVKGLHYVDIAKHGVHAESDKDNVFSLKIKEFKRLREHSNTMQLYDIKEGNALLTFKDDDIGVDVKINNFYPLLSLDGEEIRDYSLKGNYHDNSAIMKINKKIDLIYKGKVTMRAKNIDFNIFPILDYLDLIETNEQKGYLRFDVKTKGCHVSLGKSGRKILSDRIDMQVKRDVIKAQLFHHQGGILFESNDHNMTVHGRELNDEFMNHLFKFSNFKGGELSFSMQGPFEDMEGIINIKDSTIEEYTVLNNTLAFFNTIPSLVTFSVPSYSKEGLPIREMYANFHKKGDIIHVKNAQIDSEELTITAKGESNVQKESIDILMQVKTDIGSSAKNIPLIGYIIFGEDTVSTTVRVHGPLKDPEVESSVATSIIVAPYNILKRTLSLPFLPFMSDDEDNASTNIP